VKQGPYIVGRGRVTSGYEYKPGVLKHWPEEGWDHFVRVDWDRGFHKLRICLGAELTTVLHSLAKGCGD